MPAEPSLPPNHSADDIAGLAPLDEIVSVNDRGRQNGERAAPFLVIGGITLTVLIFGLLTINILRARMSGPKPAPAGREASVLSRSFESETPPPLPGAARTQQVSTPAITCADGSPGNELRGMDGVVVRNAAGQGVKVCPNGQVLAATAPSANAQAISVSRNPPAPRYASFAPPVPDDRPVDSQMMLNDGKYGPSDALGGPDTPDALVTALQAPVTARKPVMEGLLTQAPADALERQLTPSVTPMVQASRITDLNTLLPKGRSIDCGLSVRVVSSLAGLTTCVVTRNVYSANGRVLLIERGSEAVGEYRSAVAQGQRRLFVLWNRIITPGGIVINLQSPGADGLGGAGLPGAVDNHWFERIGSAFLLSTIQDGLQYEIARAQAQSGGATFVLGNMAATGDRMAEQIPGQTIDIPPTIYKNQGDRAIIYVARDLDFSNVYKLRARP